MKRLFPLIALALLATGCTTPQQPEPEKPAQKTNADRMGRSAKRGVAYSFRRTDDLEQMCPCIAWDYNWGNSATGEAATWFEMYEVEYSPMCWSRSYQKDQIREWVAANPATKYLLGFNEPNLTDQANMVPDTAAKYWPEVVATADELNLKLVAPAMNYGTLAGYSDPIVWLDEFFAKPGVSLDRIDAIAVHCYMKSPEAVQGFIDRFDKYGKPIWLTEFCAWDGGVSNVETQMTYMSKMLNYLEQEPKVERYAWFIPRYKTTPTEPYMDLLTGSPAELTDLGIMYTRFSTFDRSIYLKAGRPIYAGEYCKTKDNAVQVRVCTDSAVGTDGLMITSMNTMSPVEYQLYVPEDATKIEVRYTSYSNSMIDVHVDGEENIVDCPRTGGTDRWQPATVEMPIAAGQHTVKLELLDGSMYISGIIIQ